MIVICCVTYDNENNGRHEYTVKTYESLMQTVDFDTTRIIFIDNNSFDKTKSFLKKIKSKNIDIIYNEANVGTAEGINKGIFTCSKEDYVIKLDNDVTFGRLGWADEMKRIMELDNSIGVLGLKRKDLLDSPTCKEYPTKLEFLKHELGDEWWVIELRDDIIGTCTMISPLLREKIGYLWQPGVYSFDDTILSAKSLIAGFRNAFYPCVIIEHLDKGGTAFTDWKSKYAGMYISQITGIIDDFQFGRRDIYYNPFL
jgi:GT2 family glycosyltransferase